MPFPVDRSLAFTALLEHGWFRQAKIGDGERLVTLFLHDYYRSVDRYQSASQKPPTMFNFSANWEPNPHQLCHCQGPLDACCSPVHGKETRHG